MEWRKATDDEAKFIWVIGNRQPATKGWRGFLLPIGAFNSHQSVATTLTDAQCEQAEEHEGYIYYDFRKVLAAKVSPEGELFVEQTA